MGKPLNAVIAIAVIASGAAYAHGEGYWSSRIVDGGVEDELYRFGKLPCEQLNPIAKTANDAEVRAFLGNCAFNQWCVKDPIFRDSSVEPPVDHEVCGDVEHARYVTAGVAVPTVYTNLVAYAAGGVINPNLDADGAETQVFTAPETLDPIKLQESLCGSTQTRNLYLEGVRTVMQEQLDEVLGFDVKTVVRVSIGTSPCDNPNSQPPEAYPTPHRN